MRSLLAALSLNAVGRNDRSLHANVVMQIQLGNEPFHHAQLQPRCRFDICIGTLHVGRVTKLAQGIGNIDPSGFTKIKVMNMGHGHALREPLAQSE